MVHGQGKGWSWLSVKLLHHLGLNWVFPWIVQWRFGRDLSWVAYSHLDIRLVTEVYTNRERYMQNTFLAYLCVLFCFFAWKLAVAVWSPCPIVATRKFHFPLQFCHLSPLNISQTLYFPRSIFVILVNINSFQSFPVHCSSNGCQPVKKRGTFQLNPNLTRTTTSIPKGQMFCRSRWFGLKICLERYISENHPPDSPILRPGVWIRINRHQRFSVKGGFPVIVVRI